MDLINLVLEVPDTTKRDKLETFLQGFSFAIKNEPVDLGAAVRYILSKVRERNTASLKTLLSRRRDI